jgi:predicted RNA-binding protein YlxR (DUF448 family)
MALRSTGASDPDSAGSPTTPPRARGQRPMRTCVGCRQRTEATELLRVVAATDPLTAVPDPRRRAPGRGAWVHPVAECVDLAERRRAFARALRVPGPVDASPVREYLATSSSATPDSGTPQELKSNGHSMKRQK